LIQMLAFNATNTVLQCRATGISKTESSVLDAKKEIQKQRSLPSFLCM